MFVSCPAVPLPGFCLNMIMSEARSHFFGTMF